MVAADERDEEFLRPDATRHEQRVRRHGMPGRRRGLAHCEAVGARLGQQLLERGDRSVAARDDDRAVAGRAARVDQLAEHLDVGALDAVQRRLARQPGELGAVRDECLDGGRIRGREVALNIEAGAAAQVGEKRLPGGARLVDRGRGDDREDQRRRRLGERGAPARRHRRQQR